MSGGPRNNRGPAWVRLFLLGLLGAAAWAAILPLVPSVRRDVGPATIIANAELGTGGTKFVLPPLGSLRADTHDAPLNVQLLLSEIDFSELDRGLSESGSLSSLALRIEKDLRTLATRLALQLAVAGAVVGALAGIVLPRRHVRSIAAASLGGALAAGISISLTLITFDERAFEQPHFTGALNNASQVIEATNQGIDSFEELGSSYEALAQRVSTLLALAADRPLDIEEGAPRILHVSDIHSNPLGIEFVRRLARAFEVDAILDTGDLTSFGAPVEARLVRLLSNMPAPYYFVPGNHDSASVRAAIDEVPSVTVMDGSLQVVAGVPMIGWPDPTFTASNEISADEGNEIRLETAAEVREAVVESRPEVLAVHDLRLAAESMGEVDVVLAGHTHERAVDELSGTLVLVVGSSGATGLGSFLVETDIPYQAEILYLQEGRVIVDYVSLAGIGDEFDVERRVLESTVDE